MESNLKHWEEEDDGKDSQMIEKNMERASKRDQSPPRAVEPKKMMMIKKKK